MLEAVFCESFCLVVLGIVFLGIYLQQSENKKAASRFLLLDTAVAVFVALNVVTSLLEGRTERTTLLFVINLLIFLEVDVMLIAFTHYIESFFKNAGKKQLLALRHTMFFTVLRIILILVLAFTGTLFSIRDGKYAEESLSFLPYLASAAIQIYLLAVILINRKQFSGRQLTVVILYLAIPVPAMIVEMYTDLYVLSCFAATISVLLIYTLIQASAIERGKMRATVLEEISNTDLLTGLNNRRAFYARAETLAAKEGVGILFCDLNGLKRVNDTLGHTAGDALIKRFSDMLCAAFAEKDVYRISGDEFVVILTDIDCDAFLLRARTFRDRVAACDNISAVGFTYGAGRSFEAIVAEAEALMYGDKRAHRAADADRD